MAFIGVFGFVFGALTLLAIMAGAIYGLFLSAKVLFGK